VISPEETREYILHSMQIGSNKEVENPKRKHGIPPF
jgi:acetyl-CoA carboxylase carboxyltransferase component